MTSSVKPASVALFAALALTACGEPEDPATDPPPDATATALPETNSAESAGTRPSGKPNLVTVEGRIEAGVECPVLHTADGEIWALSLGEADFGPGDSVSITGEIADASFCMEGEGTIIPHSIDAK